jgi:hypothetical protein
MFVFTVVRMLCLCEMEVTCIYLHEVFRTGMSHNVSASLHNVHQGKVMDICVFVWYTRSGIIQRIWTEHLVDGGEFQFKISVRVALTEIFAGLFVSCILIPG